MAVLSLHCFAGFFSSCGEWGLLSGCSAQASHCGGFFCCGAQALGTQALVAAAWGLSSCDSRALEHRLSSWGIFPDQGLNLCLQHWQADFLPLSHKGSPHLGL